MSSPSTTSKMHVVEDRFNLPMPLTINLDLYRDHQDQLCYGPGQRPLLRAASPDWPYALGVSEDWAEAVAELLGGINDLQSVARAVIEELAGAGHGLEVRAAWDRHVRGERLHAFRNDSRRVHDVLDPYLAAGVDAVKACAYLGVGMSAGAAARVEASGGSPEQARPYVEALGEFCDRRSDQTYLFVDDSVADWVVSGIPVGRARKYDWRGASRDEVAEWETVVASLGISDDHFEEFMAARYTSETLRVNADRYATDPESVVEAARVEFALGRSYEAVNLPS